MSNPCQIRRNPETIHIRLLMEDANIHGISEHIGAV